MPASKSLLQGLKTCNRLGEKRGAPGARGVSRGRRTSPRDLVRAARGGSHKIVHPKATTEIMSSEAVENGVAGVGWAKMGLSSKILLKI